jgi:hypothetical protein
LAGQAALARQGSMDPAAQPSSNGSTATSTSGLQDGKVQHGLLHHPPSLTLGNSPSSSNTNLAGSPPGCGHTSSIQQQPAQQHQQPLRQPQASTSAAADETGISPDGWERPFVIGVAGGTGMASSRTAAFACTCRLVLVGLHTTTGQQQATLCMGQATAPAGLRHSCAGLQPARKELLIGSA